MKAKNATKKKQGGAGAKKNNEVKSGWIGPLLRAVKERAFPSSTQENIKATALLKKDHAKVKQLITRLQSAEENKMALVSLIEQEIKIHSQCEEKIFYPEVKKFDSKIITESLKEHNEVDSILAELMEMTGEEDRFDSKVIQLEEALQHHIEEEEGEMFPKAEEKLKDQLEELGAEIQYYKEELAVKNKKVA